MLGNLFAGKLLKIWNYLDSHLSSHTEVLNVCGIRNLLFLHRPPACSLLLLPSILHPF